MKKKLGFGFGLLLISLMVASASLPASGAVGVSGKTFLVYLGSSPAHTDISGFYTNYTAKSNTVINSTTMTLANLKGNLTTKNVDALLLPGNQFKDSDNLTFIKTWFDQGNKLLWVAGDSDFGGYFNASKINPVLKLVGSVLRLDAGAVADPVWKDGASYRVVANQLGTGAIADKIKSQVTNFTAPFHGPTAVYYEQNGVAKDLRTTTPTNVQVVVKSSANATALDQDLSGTAADFYVTSTTTGNYPLLATETMKSNMVVVSGEADFTSYKNMYGKTLEKSGKAHDGMIVVDTVIDYFFNSVATKSSSPLNFVAVTIGLVAIVVFIKKRRN